MDGIPSGESRALEVAKAKVEVRWATAEAIVGCDVNGFAQDTWVTAVHHLLVMHALNADAVPLKDEDLNTLYYMTAASRGHTPDRLRTTSCSAGKMLAVEQAETAPKICIQESSAMQLESNDTAAEHTSVEQFWRSISPEWVGFVRTHRGQHIHFDDFVSWITAKASEAGLQNPWAFSTS